MSRSVKVFWTMGFWLVPIACDSGDELTSRERACRRACAKLEVCDDKTDVADCESDCRQEEAHSEVYFTARADCVEELSCNHVTTELDNMGRDICADDCQVKDCIAKTIREQQPTDEQKNMCETAGKRLEDCDSSLNDDDVSDDCLAVAVGLSAAYLEASKECLSNTCRSIVPCFEDAADEFETDALIFSGELLLD